jgi:hypothetical protein
LTGAKGAVAAAIALSLLTVAALTASPEVEARLKAFQTIGADTNGSSAGSFFLRHGRTRSALGGNRGWVNALGRGEAANEECDASSVCIDSGSSPGGIKFAFHACWRCGEM